MSQSSNQFAKGYPVRIHIYDLSQGMATMYSQQLIGKQVDGIWHTAIVVYEKEYFYGGGIQSDTPAGTPYGKPLRTIDMGTTFKSQSQFHEHLNKAAPRFSPSKYDLFKHNCNTFANEAMQFLNGKPIPDYITGLPEEFLNSAVGQMLKPMIDNMQQTAMASYGDFGGMGIQNRPNLPQINHKYNQSIANNDNNNTQNNDNNDNNTINNEKTNSNNNNNEENQLIKAKEVSKSGHSLIDLLDKYHSSHPHQTMNLKIINKELRPKLTSDDKNASLYINMITQNSDISNIRQEQALDELLKYLNRKRAAMKKGMNVQLPVNDDCFEVLNELILMTEQNELFPVVSLLRLLLVYPNICERYNKDFMIINQVLYKIGIPFDEDSMNDDENKQDDQDKDKDQDEQINLMDISLLQFTAITAVSHLYNGESGMISVEENFINLGINGLKINNCNVRLASSRLLFNIVYELKRQYIFMLNDSNDDVTKDYTKEIDVVIKKLVRIINVIIKKYQTEKHIPTSYRLLCIIGLVCYCDNKLIKNELKLNYENIKALDVNNSNHDQLKILHNDLLTVIA